MTLTQKTAEVDTSQLQWELVAKKGRGIQKAKMYRREIVNGKPTDEIIEMNLPIDCGQLAKYMARGFKLSPDDLVKGQSTIANKVYACDFKGCEREFPTKGALGLHKLSHSKSEQTNEN